MRHFSSPLRDQANSAQVLHALLSTVTKRAAKAFPLLPTDIRQNTVFIVDGTRRAGALGSYQHGAWRVQGRRLDALTIAPHHPKHFHPDPHVWAERVFVTLLHELAHAATHLPDQVRARWPSVTTHPARFALAGTRLGLTVSWSPVNRVGAVTPSLSAYARARDADLILTLAELLPQLDNHTVSLAAPSWARPYERPLLESFLSDPNR